MSNNTIPYNAEEYDDLNDFDEENEIENEVDDFDEPDFDEYPDTWWENN